MSCGPIAWKIYLQKFNEVVDKYNPARVLKTDSNNEALDRPMRGGLVLNLNNKNVEVDLLEYDKNIVSKAKSKFPQLRVTQGDIRSINMPDNHYDLIADFSTLDHISEDDVPKALGEYTRLIGPEKYLILVCWFSYEKKDCVLNMSKWNPSQQYFMWEPDVLKHLDSFEILERQTITRIKQMWTDVPKPGYAKHYLEYFLFKKKPLIN